MAGRLPFPTDPSAFGEDHRVSFDKQTQTYKLEDENDEEWEWLATHSKWIPALDEAMLAKQQEAYKVDGVDEEIPAPDARKRKARDAEEAPSNGHAKKAKAEDTRAERKNTAVWVTSLPADATVEEVEDVFAKYGMLARSLEDKSPRIKFYYDDDGNFKGEALIIYYRPESVQIAIDMLDETDFRLGQPVITGPMRVDAAQQYHKTLRDEKPLATEEAKTKGTRANKDREKAIKMNEEMRSRLADWDDDEPSALPDTSSRWDKVMVLKHMFTLETLKEDPAALLEIPEDVREECEKIGAVTNITLYDKEDDGIVTVRFANSVAAEAAIKVFNGRWFDQRQVEASIATGREKFRKSKKTDADDKDETARLENYSKFIEGKEA